MGALDAFREALTHRGLVPPTEILADGKLHRCDVSGKNGHDDGAYVFHDDGRPAGGFQNWRDEQGWETWSYANGHEPLTTAERADMAAKIEAAKRAAALETERRHAEAAKKAAALWQEAKPGAHPYLDRKKVPAFGTLVRNGRLVIPIRGKDRELRSLQFIAADGKKLYLPGGEKKGCYFSIGKPADVICIGEGFATMATVHEATGHACVVAFDCENLEPVTEIIRQKFPNATIVVCADDDHKTTGNPGLTKATAAARAINGRLAIPVFPSDRADDATDFNDLAVSAGLEAVRAIIDRSIVEKESSAWPKPGKIAAELKPVPAFDAEALLPEVLRTWVMDEAERMPCSPDFIAAAALVALGSIIGARCAIKPKANDSWLVVPNLWGGIVGDPSAKKSPAWGAALKPMDSLIAKARTAYEAEQADYEIRKIVHGAEKEAIEANIKEAARRPGKGDPKTIAEGLRTHGENTPTEPKMRRYKTNDSTVEKLGELLRENPPGLLVLRDELVGLIATWEREGREGERAFFLEGWNGNQSFDTDRIGRGHISIPNLCVSIFGGIQPDKLTVYLEQAAYALANDGKRVSAVLAVPHPAIFRF